MRPARSLFLYFATVFAGGALLAPWLYGLAQWLAEVFPAGRGLAEVSFHRCVSRSLLVLALAGLWPLARGLGIRSWHELGLGGPRGQGKRFGTGFAVGLASLALVLALCLASGARQFTVNFAPDYLVKHFLNATLSALATAVVEEMVFRGVLFGALQRACRWQTALLVSSSLYALAHFFQRPGVPASVTWSSGFSVLAQMCRGLTAPDQLLPGFVNLLLAGTMLALAYRRTGNLYFSIGLHAGWIFWLKTGSLWTESTHGSGEWFWGSGKLIDGWLAGIVLAATLPLVYKLLSRLGRPADANAKATSNDAEKLA